MKNVILTLLSIIFIFFGVLIYTQKDKKVDNNYNIIKLGQSCPSSGQTKEIGIELNKGANAYFSYINEQGGIHNQKIRLISLDDKYEPDLTELNVKKLIEEEKVLALFNMVGTPGLNRVYSYISDHNVPILIPLSGADFLRQNNSLVFNIKKSDKDELEAIINYLTTQKHLYKLAVFYQNDSYGREGLEIAKNILNKKGLQFAAEGSYKRNTLSISHALKEITFTNPEAIIMISSCKPSAEFIKKAILKGLDNTYFFTLSFTCPQKLSSKTSSYTDKIIMSQNIPIPWDDTLPLAKEYKKLMNIYYPKSKLSFISFEGFISAKTFVAALYQIESKITRKKLMKSINNLSDETLRKYKLLKVFNDNRHLKDINLINYRFNQINILQRYSE